MLGRRGKVEVFRTMKRITILSLIILTTISLLSSCSGAQQLSSNDRPLPAEQKILIVYLSRTNNTKAIAEIIHQKVGGRMVALELETPYPTDYNATVQQVARVKSFLRQYSLKGKTVVPFNTNGGYGVGSSFQIVRELCPQSTVLQGFTTRGGSERDRQYLVIKEARAEEARKEVESWLKKIEMLK
jgi:flavodoxin